MELRKTIEAMLFTRVLSMNSEHMDFEMSNFSVFNNNSKERGDEHTKSGSGRVALYLNSNITHCYTLEAHYHKGKVKNELYESYENRNQVGRNSLLSAETIKIMNMFRKKQ